MSMGSCGGCDKKWSSMITHHCVRCHIQFFSIEAFDAHRRRGKCKPVLDMYLDGTYGMMNDAEGGIVYVLKEAA